MTHPLADVWAYCDRLDAAYNSALVRATAARMTSGNEVRPAPSTAGTGLVSTPSCEGADVIDDMRTRRGAP